MASPEEENSLFSISLDVDADDYANAAAEDSPAVVDRTHQSEAAFKSVKETYQARQDGGDLYAELCRVVPALVAPSPSSDGEDEVNGMAKVKLDKREQLLLGYAAGELYYDGRFGVLVGLCERVRERCEVDERRVGGGLERWRVRAMGRMVGEA